MFEVIFSAALPKCKTNLNPNVMSARLFTYINFSLAHSVKPIFGSFHKGWATICTYTGYMYIQWSDYNVVIEEKVYYVSFIVMPIGKEVLHWTSFCP